MSEADEITIEWTTNAPFYGDLVKENQHLREALRIIAEHSTDAGSVELARAVLDGAS